MADRRVSIVLLAVWLPAGLVGWAAQRWLSGGPAVPGDAGPFIAGLSIALGLGAAAHRSLIPPQWSDPVTRCAVRVGVGFAVANATGWSIGVEVGGPAFGVAVGFGIAAAAGVPGRHVVLLGGAVLTVMIGTRLLLDPLGPPLLGAPWTPVVLVTPALAGLAVLAAGRRLLRGHLGATAALTVAFGVAFVGLWAVTITLVAPWSFALAVGLEIVGAIAVGAALLGFLTRPGEPAAAVAARWAVAATAAVAIGVAVAVPLRAVLGDTGGGLLVHLDLGTSIGLAIAVAVAVQPTLRRVAAVPVEVGV
jgi:hypothetical protein